MLGQTDRHRQSTGGPAESARMPPRGASTTTSAAPIRSGSGGAGLGWGGAGTLPRVAEDEVREDLPDDRLILCHGFSGELEGAKVQRRWWPQRETQPAAEATCNVAKSCEPSSYA